MNTNPNDGAYPAPTALANSGPKERQEAFDALKEELDDALAELAALRAELESAHAAQRHAETELSQYMAWYAMAEHQHLHEQRLREKAEAERDAALVAVKAMHKLLDRDWAIVDRDITLRCESHDQAWNYLHEMRDLVRAALENVMPYKEPQP